MANHASATKAHRMSLRRRDVNRNNLSRLRTRIRDFREIVDAGKADEARKLFPGTVSLIAKSVQKGILHPNAAARYKSRLSRLVKSIEAK